MSSGLWRKNVTYDRVHLVCWRWDYNFQAGISLAYLKNLWLARVCGPNSSTEFVACWSVQISTDFGLANDPRAWSYDVSRYVISDAQFGKLQARRPNNWPYGHHPDHETPRRTEYGKPKWYSMGAFYAIYGKRDHDYSGQDQKLGNFITQFGRPADRPTDWGTRHLTRNGFYKNRVSRKEHGECDSSWIFLE